MRRTALRAALVASLLFGGLVGGQALPAGAAVPGGNGAPAAPTRVAWQQLHHEGNSAQARAVAIHGDLVTAAGFTTTAKSSPRLGIRTYNANTGRQIWSDALPGVSVAQAVGAGSGVVTVGGFTLSNGQSSGYVVRTYDAKTGKLLWDDTQAADREHQGVAQAVAISGGKVYVGGYIGSCAFLGEPGCSAMLKAYEARTGKLLWEAVAGLPTGFSGFTALTVSDGQVIAAGGSSDLLRLYESGLLVQSHDAETGLLKWQAPVTTSEKPGSGYEVATSIAATKGIVAVGTKIGNLPATAFGVRTFDSQTGLPKWSDKVVGSPDRADGVNGVAFTDNRLVAVGLTSKAGGAQTYLVRAYEPATGTVAWSDAISSADEIIAKAGENDDHSNQLESALTVVARGSRAYVSGRIGENCDGVAPGNCDMLVKAYDESGKQVWSDRFDRAGYDDVGQAMAISDRRLVVSGRSTSTNKYGYQAYWMVRAYKP